MTYADGRRGTCSTPRREAHKYDARRAHPRDVSELVGHCVLRASRRAAYVAAVRKRYESKANEHPAQERVRFNVQAGTVYGDLTREEIYDDER